jgi:hypothetical protein
LDRAMDADEERDYADQDPLSEMDMEEDAEILATLLKHIPSCISAADIEQLLQDIPVQPPVVVPARTVQEAIAAGDLPPLDVDAARLNAILENNLVPSHNGKGQLRTFGCIQWECELYSGRPKARCYPFNMKGHRFRGKNCQVLHMI